MNAVESFLVKVMFRIQLLVHGFVYDEQGDVNIVSMVVLIGIAVLLAVVFRKQIEGLLDDLFKAIGTSATDAVTPKGE